MNALIIAAHGSRKSGSDHEIKSLCNRLAALPGNRFRYVRPAFLQFSEPLLETLVDELVGLGVDRITVFPFFAAAGRHTGTDIPERIGLAREKYSHVTFSVTGHLGGLDGIGSLIIRELEKY